MAELEFIKQRHKVFISPRAYGDLDYKQRTNWNSNNRTQRERANVMFGRINQGLYNLANDISPNSIVSTGVSNEYVYSFSDGFGRIIYQLIYGTNGMSVYVVDFIWDYKKDPNSWWYIVEKKEYIRKLINEAVHDALVNIN